MPYFFFFLLWSAGYLEDRGLTYDLLIRLVLSLGTLNCCLQDKRNNDSYYY